MLSHLDDPIPFTADGRFRADVEKRSRRLRRRHRVMRTLTAVVIVGGIVTAAGGLYVARRDAAIDRLHVSAQPSTDGATNVLVVGPDISGNNADSIVVLRIEPIGSLRLLSIPRDLWDQQTETRINASYGGGVQSLIDSVQRVTGVPVDHYVELTFEGFSDLVDELGGLPIAINQPIRDQTTGLNLGQADCVTVDGDTLLALVRSRHLEVRTPGGEWVTDPTADLGRIARAQVLATAALVAVADAGTGPDDLDRYSRIFADHARLDSGLSFNRLVDLATAVTATDPSQLITDTLPVQAATTPGGANVLHLAAGAEQVLDIYGSADTPLDAPAPSVTGNPVVPIATC